MEAGIKNIAIFRVKNVATSLTSSGLINLKNKEIKRRIIPKTDPGRSEERRVGKEC